MKIGLIDVDSHNFPNIPLMKISAHHKKIGDTVEWYDPCLSGHLDKVYMSKVFTFTPDYPYNINSEIICKGGTGYFNPKDDKFLPEHIEHIYPDYSIYFDKYPHIKDTAYGFLTRGCPRGCNFCIVGKKEGNYSKKVADLFEFWNGQKNIVLLDPNFFACKDWGMLSQQLIDSKANIDFSQGCDIRIMDIDKIEALKKMQIKRIHFAWDNYDDKLKIIPKFEMFKKLTEWHYVKMGVYVLCNFNTSIEQDLERIYILRDLGYNPYVMIYEKEKLPKEHKLRKIQRWVNSKQIFHKVKTFEEYLLH